MDASTTEFNIDLGTFDIRDYVPDPDGASGLFDDRQAREKARHGGPHGPQRTQQNTGAQGISQGYYGHAPVPEMAAGYSSPMPTTLGAPALSIEQLDALLNMSLGQTSMGQHHSSGEQGTLPNADTLKERLAQQLRLQQLQQLQNHILQQQIQLLTAGARPLSQKDAQQLLTPASTNIRSASQSTQVSPNILPPGMFHPPASDYHTQRSAHFDPHNTMSAPASLAFDMNARGVPQSPASDFLTPLTSPVFPPTSPQRKRTAESFEGDPNDGTSGGGARKRLAHANSFGNMGLTLGMTSVSPALLSSASKHRHTNSAIDTPSPIDLSMPPPAAPGYLGGMATDPSYQRSHLSMSAMNTDTEMGMPLTIQGSRRPSLSGPSSKGTTTNVSPDLLPATPSLLMNMGNLSLPQGLIPPSMMTTDSNHRGSGPPSAQPSVPNSPARKTKTLTTRSRAASAAATAFNNNDPSSSTSTTTTSGKPRRAAAAAASSRTAAAAASGGASSLRNSSSSTSGAFGGGPKMKSTHKDAEQKRRDSLKTSFDELRVLLPPIPLSASGFGGDDSDEAPLPGAMPPRGPPRGDGSGPNKGVSKLVLLRCGNEFIRDLAGRVERRDAEIERLRTEVRRLRGVLGSVMGPGPGTSYADFGGGVEDPVDLEKDLEKEDEWYREERRRAKKKRADAIEEES